MAFFKEFACPVEFDAKVVLADSQAQSDLLDIDGFLLLLLLLGLLGLLVVIFTPVDDASHRRAGVRRYLYEIEPISLGALESFRVF